MEEELLLLQTIIGNVKREQETASLNPDVDY